MITNNQIKYIRSLSLKKNRIKDQSFIVEGEKSVLELLESSYQILKLFATHDWCEKKYNVDINRISNKDLSRVSFLKSPNKVLAIVKKPLLKKISNKGTTLVLDQITDPGNLGTIIRLSDWFNVQNIICSPNTVDCYNPKVVQATMGSIFRVNILYTDLVEYLSSIKQPIYGSFIEGNNLKSIKFPKSFHMILGNESKGISSDLMKFVTKKVTIFPVTEQRDSLNVATATAIMLYATTI